MKDKIFIKKGSEEDFNNVLNLIKELAEFEKSPESVTNTVEQMKEEKDYFEFYVAETDNKIVGFALYFYAYYTWVGKSLYLDDIYIKPEYRGKGIGKILLEKVILTAKENNCKRVRWQVLDWNENAIKFYKKNGSEISSEWLNCDWDYNFIKRYKSF